MRVRHYTRVSAMRKIMAEGRIVARDQNKVFVVKASRYPLAPKAVVSRFGLETGKGNAYVDFDVDEAALGVQLNEYAGELEYFLVGNISLTGRNANGELNR